MEEETECVDNYKYLVSTGTYTMIVVSIRS